MAEQDSNFIDLLLLGDRIPIGYCRVILAIFSENDKQLNALKQAAEKGNYKLNVVHSERSAIEYYQDYRPHIVFVDLRSKDAFNGETICKNVKDKSLSNQSTMIAVVNPSNSDKEEPSIAPLLAMGFNRRFVENFNVGGCLNELIMLEVNDLRQQVKIREADSLFAAIHNAYDSVEITTDRSQFQYVNPAFERTTGYWSSELIGKLDSVLPISDKNDPELFNTIKSYISRGRTWEGSYVGKRKSGETYPQFVRVIPIIGHEGFLTHHVTIKRDISEMETKYKKYVEESIKSYPNGKVVDPNHIKTVEASTSMVINLIKIAQENVSESPNNVTQSLDKVLQILKDAEISFPQGADFDLINFTELGNNTITSQGNLPRPSLVVNAKSILNDASAEIKIALDGASDWDYDILELERVTEKRPLVYLGMKIFERFRMGHYLNASADVLCNWLKLIEANYRQSNSYHNSTHAGDVLHASACFLDCDRVKNLLDPLDIMASLIAAIVHDVDHPGVTSAFLCNSHNPLALLYNDSAVLESHHAALAFKLTTSNDKVNIFKGLESDEYRSIRSSIIDMVLATEMTKHFSYLSKFTDCLNSSKNTVIADDGTELKVIESSSENRMLAKRILIKCADISNPARNWILSKEWALRILDEYMCQYDEEDKEGLPLTMHMFNREKCNVPQSQRSFYDYFVKDLFKSWHSFAHIPHVMKNIEENYDHWRNVEQKGIKYFRELNELRNSKDVP
ncbi:High affinity cAMP-specific and IBMX-insensitive 3',5'-cyclic phosphodiesterase 8B [Trichoplax sp. H2]|nr:High affinity cAMP-specific and IBMX-insensitive 3',5'-cyclic phosphodiesterase 8B [Trichoplax sp. H2]|eukprot:RDD45809.1 High affinity cAMP-specific and IBMX-insensitive 3',5'-cyclic phosphodiesterase 8B [Trichoplax sp. H2]